MIAVAAPVARVTRPRRRATPVEAFPNPIRTVRQQLPSLIGGQPIAAQEFLHGDVVLAGYQVDRRRAGHVVNWRWVRIYTMDSDAMHPWADQGGPVLVDWGAHVAMGDYVAAELDDGRTIIRRLAYLEPQRLGLQRYVPAVIEWVDLSAVTRLARCPVMSEWATANGAHELLLARTGVAL